MGNIHADFLRLLLPERGGQLCLLRDDAAAGVWRSRLGSVGGEPETLPDGVLEGCPEARPRFFEQVFQPMLPQDQDGKRMGADQGP
jgi:hypothetical protein